MNEPREPHDPREVPHGRTLSRRDLDADPIVQFDRWLGDAVAADIPLPNAMALATADAEARPSVRHVLLRGLDSGSFLFFTNYKSRKGRQLAGNPHAALVFLWKALDRQVNVTGTAERVSGDESDAYFRTRPREARIGAWASRQSQILENREELERQVREAEERFPDDDVPRPPHWGGYRLVPDSIEFWQGRDFRLHDRFRYEREGAAWRIERLSP